MIKSGDGTDAVVAVQLPAVSRAARGRPEGVRLAVRLREPPGHRGLRGGRRRSRTGADCLLIDAESEYEGKYVSAQTYIPRLRELIGYNYPLALAGFPYIDYHPAFPYSVFLGPGGAQYNAPQMYWRDIGVTTDTVFAHTYSYNLRLRTPDLPAGAGVREPAGRARSSASGSSRACTAPPASAGGTGRRRAGAAWTAISRPSGTLARRRAPCRTWPTSADGARATWWCGPRSTSISAGYPIADQRRLRLPHAGRPWSRSRARTD